MASEIAKDRAAKLLKKQNVAPLPVTSNRSFEKTNRIDQPLSSVYHADEPFAIQQSTAARIENTFQLGPSRKYPVSEVRQILKDVLESYLAEERYEPDLCKQMSKTVSEVVRNRVKELRLRRYKVVAIVTIGAVDGSATLASRCVWDSQVDNYATYEFRNNSLMAQATVYGIYQE